MKHRDSAPVSLLISLCLEALEWVKPEIALRRRVEIAEDVIRIDNRSWFRRDVRRVLFLGAGKASGFMAETLMTSLPDSWRNLVSGGIVIVKDGHYPSERIGPVRVTHAAHPVPDQRAVMATETMIALLQGVGKKDLIFFCLSGGASSLLIKPRTGVTLETKQEMVRHLLACGASIDEINTLRIHLSDVKGGGLLRHAQPARMVTLAISDVKDDRPALVGSGPTARTFLPSTTRISELVDKYGISDFPRLERRAMSISKAEIDETYRFIANNADLCEAVQSIWRKKKPESSLHIDDSFISGDVEDVADGYLELVKNLNPRSEHLLISGGEPTVVLGGTGRGGRNTHLALLLLLKLEEAGWANVTVACFASDGGDGSTDAAGACGSVADLALARKTSLDPEEFLSNFDSYTFFERIGRLIRTGPTKTNVGDLHLIHLAPLP